MTSKRHEELLYKELHELEAKGWRTMSLGMNLPDAIVISPDRTQIVAIEVLGRKKRKDPKGRSKGYVWDGGKNVNVKRWKYGRYDDIFFILFDRGDSGWTKRLVASEEWPEMMEHNRQILKDWPNDRKDPVF